MAIPEAHRAVIAWWTHNRQEDNVDANIALLAEDIQYSSFGNKLVGIAAVRAKLTKKTGGSGKVFLDRLKQVSAGVYELPMELTLPLLNLTGNATGKFGLNAQNKLNVIEVSFDNWVLNNAAWLKGA